jgi:hypothetical protein
MRLTRPQDKVSIVVIGAGNRSGEYLKAMEKYYHGKYEVVGVFDPNPDTRHTYKERYNLKENQLFEHYEKLNDFERLADVAIIGTPDNLHYGPAMIALEKGYDIILEKPISMTLEETIQIGELGKKHPNQIVAVCHVMRHSPWVRKIKEIVDSKVLGEIIDIQHNENIGYFHFAHSYVRGNWRNTDVAAPIIVAKSCHDMDLLLYLLNEKSCKRVASMGSLSFFNHDHYKEGMAPKCVNCSVEKDCPFSALKIYGEKKIKSIQFDTETKDLLREELEHSPYGRCVFLSDNNVPDHQVTILEFDGGVHATFNMSAFTNKIHRSIKIMCQYGEIRATEIGRVIEVTKFGEEPVTIIPDTFGGHHGGADEGFVQNFMKSYLENIPFDSTLDRSIQSHVMAFAAEASRLQDGMPIILDTYYQETLSKGEKVK